MMYSHAVECMDENRMQCQRWVHTCGRWRVHCCAERVGLVLEHLDNREAKPCFAYARDDVQRAATRGRLFTLARRGHLVGYATVTDDGEAIEFLEVLCCYRRQGAGRALVAAIEAWHRRRGRVGPPFAATAVLPAARPFWLARGYRKHPAGTADWVKT
jgi:GNAT superfamily N-acetyltransferase